MLNLGVLVSGRGSNLQAILDAIAAGKLAAQVAVVISDNPEAPALARARGAGIPTAVFRRRDYPNKGTFFAAIQACLQEHTVDLVVLAGFMRLLPPEFIAAFSGRIMNIHPALLPAFPGLRAQRQALEYGVKVAGCTVHFVDQGMDTGPIILQAAVPVQEDDTEETLAARILVEEHRLYPQAIQLFAEGRLVVEGRRVRIKDAQRPGEA